jgi:hypothetical protein
MSDEERLAIDGGRPVRRQVLPYRRQSVDEDDVDPDMLLMDPVQIEGKISPRAKAIGAVRKVTEACRR